MDLLLSAEGLSPVSIFWSLPFILLLAAIATGPLFYKHFWEHHYPKVAIAFAALTAIYYIFVRHDSSSWLHEMQEYVSFIALLGSLYVVSGGILIKVARKGTPAMNVGLLLLGAIFANIVGTTGASMLLIRPYIRMNRNHIKPYHIVFFIFLVSNVGGALTPIGDPPLFLGYLQGVPFWWVFDNCQQMWAIIVAILLVVFFIIDSLDHKNETRHHDRDGSATVQISGIHNFIFIALIVYAVFRPGLFDGITDLRETGVSVTGLLKLLFSREILMLLATIGSRLLTPAIIYVNNEFNYAAIKEVAILFIGIFSTMVPALQWLEQNAEKLPVKTTGNFYFMSGGLSAVLDNAPTYMTFLQVKLGRLNQDEIDEVLTYAKKMSDAKSIDIPVDLPQDHVHVRQTLEALIKFNTSKIEKGHVTRRDVEIAMVVGQPEMNLALVAISMGAVFFGAMTYIGNGPNFMVKSIADSQGIATPSFMEYIYKYSLPILLPCLILIWAIFLRG